MTPPIVASMSSLPAKACPLLSGAPAVLREAWFALDWWGALEPVHVADAPEFKVIKDHMGTHALACYMASVIYGVRFSLSHLARTRIQYFELYAAASVAVLKAQDAARCVPEIVDLVVGNLALVCASNLPDLGLFPGHQPLSWASQLHRLASGPRFAPRPSVRAAAAIVLAYASLPRKFKPLGRGSGKGKMSYKGLSAYEPMINESLGWEAHALMALQASSGYHNREVLARARVGASIEAARDEVVEFRRTLEGGLHEALTLEDAEQPLAKMAASLALSMLSRAVGDEASELRANAMGSALLPHLTAYQARPARPMPLTLLLHF